MFCCRQKKYCPQSYSLYGHTLREFPREVDIFPTLFFLFIKRDSGRFDSFKNNKFKDRTTLSFKSFCVLGLVLINTGITSEVTKTYIYLFCYVCNMYWIHLQWLKNGV